MNIDEYDIFRSIKAIDPNAKVAVHEDDVDRLEWQSTPISKADILAKQAELKAAYDAKKYQRDRKAEYPSVVDQLDDIYHNGIDAWKATIKTTKDKYPKP